MIVKLIIISSIFISFISANIFDNLYILGDYSHIKDKKKFLYKMSKTKTIEFGDDSFIYINPIATLTVDFENKTNKFNVDIREFYYNSFYLDDLFNLQLGRSIKTFNVTQTSILNFISPEADSSDPNDKVLKIKAMDGFSLTLNNPISENMQYITLHTYLQNITKKDERKNSRYLLELTESGDSYSKSIFIFFKNNKYDSATLTYSGSIKDNFIYASVLKYKSNEYINSVTNLEYSLTNENIIGAEWIYLANKIDGKYDRIEKHNTFRTAKEFSDFYSDLTSKQYLFFYTRNTILDISTRVSLLQNLKDSSQRFNLQANYLFNNGIDIDLQGTFFNGEKNSEFKYIQDNFLDYQIKLFISYNF